jgi:predicted DNA-binding transcriptional regulator YafY
MNRLDRLLGMLLLLRARGGLSAAALAQRFEVSPRTIYRDIATLSTSGVPVYTERGRRGGVRLLEGYFLPPVMLTRGEALALLLGAALLRSLRAKPFAADLDGAKDKLIAALPESEHPTLRALERHVGFEQLHSDAFHPAWASEQAAAWHLHVEGSREEASRELADAHRADDVKEGAVVVAFVQAIIQHETLAVSYRSPYRPAPQVIVVTPLGVFWDRGYWYLVGQSRREGGAEVGASAGQENGAYASPRLWRADRVLEVHTAQEREPGSSAGFDIAAYLGRNWLRSAMARWAEEAPVRIRLTHAQAAQLRADWYFRYATFEAAGEGRVVMTFGETDEDTVLELVRWLGPHAELLEPVAWRRHMAMQLEDMRRMY